MMLRVARTYVSTDASAQEVVQDAWLAIVRGLDRSKVGRRCVQQMRATIRALGRVPVESLSEEAQAELVRAFRDLQGPAASQ